MSLFDFFFPEQAQATHLRSLANAQRTSSRRSRRTESATDRRIDALEDDLGYVALVLGSLLQQIDDKGVVNRDDVKATIKELDGVDGVTDGKLDVSVLRGMSN